MRHLVVLIVLLASSFTLVACGGSSSKKGGGDDKSSYEQLEAMSTDIDTAVNNVTMPIDMIDQIITGIEELPTKYTLSPDDVKGLLTSALSGGGFEVPASLEGQAKADLEKFLNDLSAFKNSIVNAPDNALALGKTLAEALVTVPVLVGKVGVETAATQANPFASKEDKAKAKTQADGVKQMQEQLTAKISEVQSKVTELPAKAQNAFGKFVGALGKAGIDNLDAILQSGKDAANDAKAAAQGAADATMGAATDAANAAAGDAKGAAEGAAKDAVGNE